MELLNIKCRKCKSVYGVGAKRRVNLGFADCRECGTENYEVLDTIGEHESLINGMNILSNYLNENIEITGNKN